MRIDTLANAVMDHRRSVPGIWNMLHVALASIALAGAMDAAAAPADAKTKALYASCAGCHGATGEGSRALAAPNIGGMEAWYLRKQLDDFAAGRRGTRPADVYGARMRAVSLSLNATERGALATYVAALPKTPARKTAEAGAGKANGATQYNALCSACHGADGKGNPALGAPRLAGIDNTYLARQYANFRTGLRGTDPADKRGRQMAAISRMLPDAAAERDVMAYIAGLKP